MGTRGVGDAATAQAAGARDVVRDLQGVNCSLGSCQQVYQL